MTGNDITAGAPLLDSTALTQAHALTGDNIASGSPVLDSPALGDPGLAGNDIFSGAPILDSPALTQVHALAGNDVFSGAPVLDSPALGDGSLELLRITYVMTIPTKMIQLTTLAYLGAHIGAWYLDMDRG